MKHAVLKKSLTGLALFGALTLGGKSGGFSTWMFTETDAWAVGPEDRPNPPKTIPDNPPGPPPSLCGCGVSCNDDDGGVDPAPARPKDTKKPPKKLPEEAPTPSFDVP